MNPFKRFSSKQNFRNLWKQYSVVFLLLAFILFFHISRSDYHSIYDFDKVILNSTALMITVVGLSFVMVSGGVDFSIGYQMSLIAVVISRLSVAQQPEWAILLCALSTGLLCGLLNGILVSYLEIVPFAATIATQIIFRGISFLISGGSMVTNLSILIRNLTRSTFLFLRVDLWLLILSYLMLFFILRFTLIGKSLRAVGLNEAHAIRSGIPVKHIKCSAYSAAGLFYAVATMVLISQRGYAGSETGIGMEITAIVAAYIGGALSLAESQNVLLLFLGALVVAIVESNLPKVGGSSYLQFIITGVLLIITMVLHRRRAEI